MRVIVNTCLGSCTGGLRMRSGGEARMGRALPEAAQTQGLGWGRFAHLLLGVHHWHPLEDTKGSVAHSHPALLPVGEWGDWVRKARGQSPPAAGHIWGYLQRSGWCMREGAVLLTGHRGRKSPADPQGIHGGVSGKSVAWGHRSQTPGVYVGLAAVRLAGDAGILAGGVSKLEEAELPL